jgi:hypothetical protein
MRILYTPLTYADTPWQLTLALDMGHRGQPKVQMYPLACAIRMPGIYNLAVLQMRNTSLRSGQDSECFEGQSRGWREIRFYSAHIIRPDDQKRSFGDH